MIDENLRDALHTAVQLRRDDSRKGVVTAFYQMVIFDSFKRYPFHMAPVFIGRRSVWR